MSIRTEPPRPDAGNRERFRVPEGSVATTPAAVATAAIATRIVAGTSANVGRTGGAGRPGPSPSAPAAIDEVEDDDHREERDDRRHDVASQVHVSPRSECEA